MTPAFSVCLMVVLILVLMEYGLGRTGHLELRRQQFVLILVLMEYGLGRQ